MELAKRLKKHPGWLNGLLYEDMVRQAIRFACCSAAVSIVMAIAFKWCGVLCWRNYCFRFTATSIMNDCNLHSSHVCMLKPSNSRFMIRFLQTH